MDATTDCIWYDTYDNAFAACFDNNDCRAKDDFFSRHPTGRVEEDSPDDILGEIGAIEHAVEEAVDPHGGAVVYSLHFDEGLVNAWMENQHLQFTSIGRMFESEVHSWMECMEEVNEEHAPRFEEIH